MKKYVIGFLILIVISVFLIGCGTKTTIYPAQSQVTGQNPSAPATTPSQPQTTPSSPSSTAAAEPVETSEPTASDTMAELRNCESVYGIGWIPNSCELDDDSFKVTIKAVGQNGISGIAFYIIGQHGVQKVLTDSTKVSALQSQTYSFSRTDFESKVGGKIEKIYAMPIKTMGEKDYACYNQQLLIIKDFNCRG